MYMYTYIHIYIHTYIYMYIYAMFVNEIPASHRAPDDPGLARFSVPTKIAQTLAR